MVGYSILCKKFRELINYLENWLSFTYGTNQNSLYDMNKKACPGDRHASDSINFRHSEATHLLRLNYNRIHQLSAQPLH
jgi:hypothetical protein